MNFFSIRTLTLMLLVGACSVPLHTVHALVPLETQLDELREYVERLVGSKRTEPLASDELRESIALGARWLTNAQGPSGRFRYEYRPYDDRYSGGDNIVRQAGTLYALGEMLKHDRDDPLKLSSSAERAIEYFDDISKKGEYGGTSFRCIVEHGASTRCELGATALALTAILAYTEYAPMKTSQYQEQIDGYRAFILAMQKQNGGFRNVFLIGRPNQSDTESAFSNGEALLALTRLYNFKSDDAVKDAIESALAYLTAAPFDANLYLWIMAAMKEVNAIDVRLQNFSYVRDFTLWRIDRARLTGASTRNSCAYVEGVVSALSVLKGRTTDDTYSRIRDEADFGLRKNRALQITERDASRAFIGATGLEVLSYARPLRAVGGFLTSEDERTQRIDFTQHCVNAYLQMLTDVRSEKLVR